MKNFIEICYCIYIKLNIFWMFTILPVFWTCPWRPVKLHFSHVHALNTLKFLSFCQPSITKKCICSSLLKSSFILPQFISCTGVYIWQKYQQRLFSQLCVTSSLKCVSFIIIFFFQYLAHSLASQLFLPFVCVPYCMQIWQDFSVKIIVVIKLDHIWIHIWTFEYT